MPAETVAAVVPSEDIHAWEAGGATSAEALSAWVSARLAAHEAALAALLAVEGPRTPENSLRLFDWQSSSLAWPERRPACSTPWPPTRRCATRRRMRRSACPWPEAL